MLSKSEVSCSNQDLKAENEVLFRENQVLRVKYESIKERFQVERSLSPPTRMRSPAEKDGGGGRREEGGRRGGGGKEEGRREEGMIIEMEQKLFNLREENGRLLCMNEKLMEEVEKFKEVISQLEYKHNQKDMFSQRNVLNNYHLKNSFKFSSNVLPKIPFNVQSNLTSSVPLNVPLFFELLDQYIQKSIEKTTSTFLDKIRKNETQLENLKRMTQFIKNRMDESKHQYGVLLRELERKNEKVKEIRKDMVSIFLQTNPKFI